MSFEEKSAWITGFTTALSYAAYVAIILSAGLEPGITQVGYIAVMVVTIILMVAVMVALYIIAAISAPKEAGVEDARDRQISRYGENIGMTCLAVCAMVALGLCLIKADHFWIANVLYLGFVVGTVVSSVLRILAYRRGFQPW